MNQVQLFKPVPTEKLELQSKEDLIEFIKLQQTVNDTLKKEVDRLCQLNEELEQKSLQIEEQYVTIKNKFFGKSSEREPSGEDHKKANQGGSSQGKKTKKKIQLPSLRYPDIPLIEREVELKELPSCPCCANQMSDSGMTENSEYLSVVPAQYLVIRVKRHKYRCGKCQGAVLTAPSPARIKPGSSYSDEMMIDIAMSKYCDLIPIDRYRAIAERLGVMELPPQSLIEQTHYLAGFVEGAYKKIRSEILESKVLHADETPHRMLEGAKKGSWYLWGFSNDQSSYFECRPTRSGDVASELLGDSECEYLVSDVFSGYRKAVRETNVVRLKKQLPQILNVYCNAHARRYFKQAVEQFEDEAQYFVDQYKKIYRLEKIAKARPPDRILRVRGLMKKIFLSMRDQAMERMGGYSSKSSIAKAMNYFLKNYKELTRFIEHSELPIDNNHQERLLRSPVVGRKTWYGTHSKKGAKTMAIIFSLVESCKLNHVNPREYFKGLVQDLHKGAEPYTPAKFNSRNSLS